MKCAEKFIRECCPECNHSKECSEYRRYRVIQEMIETGEEYCIDIKGETNI